MFLHQAALRPIPSYAVVQEHALASVQHLLEQSEDLQEALDQGYRELDARQPVLGQWLSDQVSARHDELAQSLGYFLAVTVYIAFREAFPTRLGEVDADALRLARETLAVDEQLRQAQPTALDSDDIVAMGQPLLVEFVQHHLQEASEQADDPQRDAELEPIYRAILVEIIAFSHAVASPSGQSGPPQDQLD